MRLLCKHVVKRLNELKIFYDFAFEFYFSEGLYIRNRLNDVRGNFITVKSPFIERSMIAIIKRATCKID